MDTEKQTYTSEYLEPRPSDRIPIRKGAKVAVHLLRKNGLRLSPAEREALPPLMGHMIVTEANDRSRNLLSANIYSLSTSHTVLAPLSKPLIDPQLIHMDERGIVFRGFEIDIVEGRVVEYSQVWLVKALP